MPVTGLIRRHGLIIVPARLWGRDGTVAVMHLALDTASTETLIKPHVLARLGYTAHDAERMTRIQSAIGSEAGYLVRVARLWALGFEVGEHPVHAHELPGQYDIDGLLGLRFLDHFDYQIRSRRREIDVQLAHP